MVNPIIRLIILFAAKVGEESAKTRPGSDCGSDRELLITKFRLKLKKVRKTTRPFRYDLNQIPYDYTVGWTNRFLPLSQWKSRENHEIRNFCCFKSPVYTYGEALYSQQKQDLELTVAQIMNSLLPNSDLN